MNKYEKALADVANETVDRLADGYYQPKTVEHFHSEAIGILRELVERATPKRPYVRGFNPDAGYPESGFYCCPNCCERIAWFDLSNEKRDYNINHCFYCGQALDWRVEDGKTMHN